MHNTSHSYFKEILEKHDSIEFNLSFISRSFELEIFKRAKELGLDPHNYKLLDFINNHEGIIQKDLAQFFDKNQSTITRSLNRLEYDGFIKRVHEENKKNNIIVLTQRGEKVITEINELAKNIENKFLYNFTTEEKEIFTDLAYKLALNCYEEHVNK